MRIRRTDQYGLSLLSVSRSRAGVLGDDAPSSPHEDHPQLAQEDESENRAGNTNERSEVRSDSLPVLPAPLEPVGHPIASTLA